MKILPVLKRLAGDIRFWIALYFLLRLYGITHPPIEVSQSWRQAIVNMVARNFLEENNSILYPMLDNSGHKSGYAAMEFPLLNYIIYLFHELFGYAHWYGRLINLVVSSLGVYCFYRWVKQLATPKTAFWSAFVLLNSLWLSYSQKIMPDTFSCSLVLAGAYFGYRFLQQQRWWQLALFALLLAAGALSKFTALAVLAFFVLPMLAGSFPLKRWVLLGAGGAVALLPAVWWYAVWAPHLYTLSGFVPVNYTGTPVAQNLATFSQHILPTLETMFVGTLGIAALLLFLAGTVLAAKQKRKGMLVLLGLNLAGLFLVMAKTSQLYDHAYYLLPFVPFMAYMAAYAVQQLKKPAWLLVAGLLLLGDGWASQYHNFLYNEKAAYKLQLETLADKVAGRQALVVVNGGDNPSDLYFLHRRGWTIPNQRVNEQHLQQLKQKGAQYFYCLHCPQALPYSKVLENDWLVVYEL